MSAQKNPDHFETRAERRARKRLERKQGPPPRKFPGRHFWLFFSLAIIVGGWWLVPNLAKQKSPAASNSKHRQLVNSCTTDAATTFHIHPHLAVIINGITIDIPTGIGADSNCLHPIHTHDTTGVVHIESPTKDDFTLSDFFGIWKKDYSPTKILDQVVTVDSKLKLFVNGQEVMTGPSTIMQDKTSYVIIYGPASTDLKPPANYDFPKDL